MELAVFTTACLLTGFSKSGLGGGIGGIITFMLVRTFGAQTAIAISLPVLMIADAFAIRSLWGQWEARFLHRLMPGVIVGVVIGTYVLATTPPNALTGIIGALMITFAVSRPLVRRFEGSHIIAGPGFGFAVGGIAGVTSALAHIGGSPVAIYLLLQRLEPIRYVGTIVMIFTVVNWIKVPAFLAADVFDWTLQLRLAPGLLAIPAGAAIGRRVVHRINREQFDRVILALIALGGVMLLM